MVRFNCAIITGKNMEHINPVKISNTVKSVLKINKTKILMTNGSLMKVESIAECSPWSILLYFSPALYDNRY